MQEPARSSKRATTEQLLADEYDRGVSDTALTLTEALDDCDRALEALEALSAPESVHVGLTAARDRMVAQFEKLGLESLMPLEQDFDPLFHEAIAAEPSDGRDNIVVRVHRRGWMQNGKLLRPALVTVSQGLPGSREEDSAEDDPTGTFEMPQETAEIAFPRRRRRPQTGTDFFGGPQ